MADRRAFRARSTAGRHRYRAGEFPPLHPYRDVLDRRLCPERGALASQSNEKTPGNDASATLHSPGKKLAS